MKFASMSSTAVSRNPMAAKRAADEQPLVITEHGEPRYVLLNYKDFQQNFNKQMSLLEALADPLSRFDNDFQPERIDFSGRDFSF
jgi:prevent-host-death family protein